jgi:glyoxylase-like metal-dependent hydrolase (beta-lactamase superfamily II)
VEKLNWEILTIGNLSRNKFWGESNHTCYHPVLATSTVIWDDGQIILVDPSEPLELLSKKLDQYCGLKPEQVDIVFSTHFHGDHRVDAHRYPNAACYMSETALADLEWAAKEVAAGTLSPRLLDSITGVFGSVSGSLTPHIRLIDLPGHTPGSTGLLFPAAEGRMLISGDTIMGVEYFEHCEGYWFNKSQEETRVSIRKAALEADWIIPGHGDIFSVQAHQPQKEV